MGVNSLPKTVTRQRRGYDMNPGPSAPESSTLTTRLYRATLGMRWLAVLTRSGVRWRHRQTAVFVRSLLFVCLLREQPMQSCEPVVTTLSSQCISGASTPYKPVSYTHLTLPTIYSV